MDDSRQESSKDKSQDKAKLERTRDTYSYQEYMQLLESLKSKRILFFGISIVFDDITTRKKK